MSESTSTPKQVGDALAAKARKNANEKWVHRLERFGFVVRGVIYIVVGLLALDLPLGAGRSSATPTSAIALMGSQPFGKILLALIAVGLLGYALWGFVRAFLDPLGRGTKPQGLADRAGYFISGISYAVLLIPTILALLNRPGIPVTGGGASGTATSMMGPSGKQALTLIIGGFWLLAGAGQLYFAYSERFLRDLMTNKMNLKEIRYAEMLGKMGYGARGIVFMVIGLLVLKTVPTSNGAPTQGFDSALAALASAPGGEVLLSAVAIGLILFGLYSALGAKWVRIGPPQKA